MQIKGYVITVAQQKGGAGKTTLSAHLAIALSQKKNRVALVDIDPQGSLKHWYNLRAENLGEDYTGIHFLTLSGWKISNELYSLKQSYDFIIIDSPPHIETDTKSVIKEADLVLVPLQPSPADAWATKATLELSKTQNIPTFLILNRVIHNSRLAENLRKIYPNILKSTIGNRVAFANCLLEGKCVTETQPKSLASDDIKRLVNEIQAIITKTQHKK